MINFDFMKERAKKKYDTSMKEISYWEKVYKNMKKNKDKGLTEFSIEFEHSGFLGDFCTDDEGKIEAYAKDLGYEVNDEEIKSDSTTYHFRKIKEEK